MKKSIIPFIFLLMCASALFAQAPKMFKYQSVVRDNVGNILQNQTVAFKLSILQGSISGNVEYAETQSKTTNNFGLVNLEIGGGTLLSGSIDSIDWANGPFYMKVELDINNGTNFTLMGTSQLLSVPYALYAEKSGAGYTAGPGITINSNVISADMSLMVSNFGDTLYLVPGNYVIIPGISNGNSAQPGVVTSVVSGITAINANCGYSVSMIGLPVITERGICWGTNHLPDTAGSHNNDGGGTGTYQSAITGLSPNTIYYVRAYAINTNGIFFGSELMFNTAATVPTVTTIDTASVGTTTASCIGEVIDEGGASVVARGICYSSSANPPTVSNSTAPSGAGAGQFTSTLTGLSNNTTYYYRAYATNNNGVTYGYGLPKSFTTDCAAPIVITDTVLSSGCNSAVVNCHIPSAGCANVTERGICYATSQNPDIWDSKIASGSGTGSYSVPITILVPNIPYYVRSYATTTNGTTYGNQKVFSTTASYYAGFESGMPAGWTGNWAVSTGAPYEGNFCLYTGNTNDSIKFTFTITNPAGAQISFYRKASYSFWTSFYDNNVLIGKLGDEGWNRHAYPISVGTHVFKWINEGGGPSIDYVIICP